MGLVYQQLLREVHSVDWAKEWKKAREAAFIGFVSSAACRLDRAPPRVCSCQPWLLPPPLRPLQADELCRHCMQCVMRKVLGEDDAGETWLSYGGGLTCAAGAGGAQESWASLKERMHTPAQLERSRGYMRGGQRTSVAAAAALPSCSDL